MLNKIPPVTIRLKCFNLNVENNKNNFLTRGFTGSELNQLNIQIFSSELLVINVLQSQPFLLAENILIFHFSHFWAINLDLKISIKPV